MDAALPSVDAARVIAYASPAVAFVTTVASAAATGTVSIALPAAMATGTPDGLVAAFWLCLWSGGASFLLGNAFATACDGQPFCGRASPRLRAQPRLRSQLAR